MFSEKGGVKPPHSKAGSARKAVASYQGTASTHALI